MKYKIIILLFIFFLQDISAQENFKTHLKINDIVSLFSASSLQWAIPVSPSEKVNLQWQERKTSFAEKERIRTFVGYKNQNLVSVISLSSGKIAGTLYWENAEMILQTSDDGFLVIHKEDFSKECGTCSDASCHNHKSASSISTQKAVPTLVARTTLAEPKKVILDDDVLRVYRLALAVSNNFYEQTLGANIDNVKTFWANTEAGLNEIYLRDLGIKFEIVKDERLILKDKEKDPFKGGATSRGVISVATREINRLIGEENYDLGAFLVIFTDAPAGLANPSYGYFREDKAAATVKFNSLYAIAHEIGHLFGASHVHSNTSRTSGYSHKTETNLGQSVMGYGTPQNFFSLVTLEDIRSELLALPYYTDVSKKTKVGEKIIPQDFDNFPVGVKTSNKAPVINRDRVKDNYQLPKNTFFQFHIQATDPDNDPLLYAAHQADKAVKGKSFAKFYTHKPSENNRILFQEEYGSAGNLERPLSTALNETYTFWLGVNDGKDAHLRANHATRYDVFETKVKIVEAKPFRITKGNAYAYKKGERVILKWDVDEKLFANTKVRIWLSDDFGESFKYLLEASTDNDGECEVVLPQIEIGKVKYKNNIEQVRAGVFKIEVIDHIAYALSALNPTNGRGVFTGGFLVEDSQITFTDTPEAVLNLKETDPVPQKYDVKASTQCSRGLKGTISFEEKEVETNNQRVITRTWTAEDYCGTKASWVQHIFITKEEKIDPPTDGGNNPQDGGNNPQDGGNNPQDGANDTEDEAGGSEGEAGGSGGEAGGSGDEAGSSGGEANDAGDKIIIYNAVSTDFSSENYLKIENLDRFGALHIEIYNELGQKIYQSKNYGQKGDVFRGYANVNGVVGKGKRLPSGTYFYILKYQTTDKGTATKRGYLFVK